MTPAADGLKEARRLVELRERVEKATGPDQAIDADLYPLFSPYAMTHWRLVLHDLKHGIEDERIPRFTASIDAALALVERVLPACAWTIEPDACWIRIPIGEEVPEFQGHFFQRGGKATALAILLAMLAALIALAEAAPGQEGGA